MVDKKQFNARSEGSMRQVLRSMSWVEKVESIERMNDAGRAARAAMRNARLAAIEKQSESPSDRSR